MTVARSSSAAAQFSSSSSARSSVFSTPSRSTRALTARPIRSCDHQSLQRGRVVDRLAIELDQDVVALDPAPLGGAFGQHLEDLNASALTEPLGR